MKYLLHGEQTDGLRLLPVNESDFTTWLEFHKNPAASLHWISEKGTPVQECAKWYAKQQWRYENDMGGMNSLVEKNTGRFVGYAGLLVQQVDGATEMEIAYSLLPAHWNKGYATEVAAKCRDIAFTKSYAGSLVSIISITNVPSQKVAVKVGMYKDVQTIYSGNEVYIFRINKSAWP